MGHSPKKVKTPPPVPPPVAEPALDENDTMGFLRRTRFGRRKTLLAGGAAPQGTERKTLLG
jgi:hypothetical protein